jgi:vacuolar protein sorting-associated protein 16
MRRDLLILISIQRLQGPFTKMAVSPNGKFLALFTSEGKLWVVSTDFQKNLSEFATKSGIPPQQLAW